MNEQQRIEARQSHLKNRSLAEQRAEQGDETWVANQGS